ncbi:MAG: hypothetical protein QF479_00035 [Candidatus Poseidoniaceae archaeon]|nr:hypothetical protein [Candidatus Poseidoniaceae archaeon]
MKTAIATFGFGRPEYFARMLTSLGKCPEIIDGTLDVFHYLDGGEGSEQSHLQSIIEESGIPYHSIISRPVNYGVGRQLIGARREIFDQLDYDRLVMVENDVELNPTYFTTLLNLSNWSQQFSDIGPVQVWNVEQGGEEELRPCLNQVELTNRHFVTYCITKQVWNAIKSTLYDYEAKYLLKKTYANRPHYRIRAFMKRILRRPVTAPQGDKLSPPSEAISHPFPKISWRKTPTSQDAITSLALHQAGLFRLTTRVSHAFYFGELGVHCTPEVYAEMGFNEQGHWQWKKEDIPESFEVRYKDENGRWLNSIYR